MGSWEGSGYFNKYFNKFDVTENYIISTCNKLRWEDSKNEIALNEICGANQWTGFYMITVSVIKEPTGINPFHDSGICLCSWEHQKREH